MHWWTSYLLSLWGLSSASTSLRLVSKEDYIHHLLENPRLYRNRHGELVDHIRPLPNLQPIEVPVVDLEDFSDLIPVSSFVRNFDDYTRFEEASFKANVEKFRLKYEGSASNLYLAAVQLNDGKPFACTDEVILEMLVLCTIVLPHDSLEDDTIELVEVQESMLELLSGSDSHIFAKLRSHNDMTETAKEVVRLSQLQT